MINLDDDPTAAAPVSTTRPVRHPWHDATVEQREAHTAAVARETSKALKKVGATLTRQNYKGSGSVAYRRQVFVRFASGALLDIWFGHAGPDIQLGGVCCNRLHASTVPDVLGRTVSLLDTEGALRDPREVANEVADILGPWASNKGA